MSTDFDILIVGGGLVGGSLALALRHSTLRIGLVEAVTDAERQASSATCWRNAASRSPAPRDPGRRQRPPSRSLAFRQPSPTW